MASLQDFGLGGAISMVRGGESGRSKAESISAVRSSYAAVPGETAMVGDAVSDIRAGKEAGVRTVAVSWGFQDRELLLREAPDILIEDPEELLTVESRCINWPRNGEV